MKKRTPFQESPCWKVLFALLVILLPNVIVGGAAYWLGVARPVVNFDYVVIALLVIVAPRALVVMAFVLVFAFDLLGLVRQVVPILDIRDSLYLLQFIDIAPPLYQLAFVSAAVTAVLLSIFLWHASRLAHRATLIVTVNLCLLAYVVNLSVVDAAMGDYRRGVDRWVASQLRYAYAASVDTFLEEFSDVEGDAFSPRPVFGLTRTWFDEPGVVADKILLVVSESWGATSEPLQQAVLQPLISRQERIASLRYGAIDFSGITVSGELRELCGLQPRRINLKDVESGFETCLPNLYRGLGYHTLSLHGAVGSMYSRNVWYPRTGFSESLFFESQRWQSRCYSFPGVCDAELLESAVAALENNDKAFVYWLTLNSHSPYDLRDLVVDGFDCRKHGVDVTSESCRNLKLHYQFFYNLARRLEASEISGLKVVVVGDHEPRILDAEEMGRYFNDAQVSWVSFDVE